MQRNSRGATIIWRSSNGRTSNAIWRKIRSNIMRVACKTKRMTEITFPTRASSCSGSCGTTWTMPHTCRCSTARFLRSTTASSSRRRCHYHRNNSKALPQCLRRSPWRFLLCCSTGRSRGTSGPITAISTSAILQITYFNAQSAMLSRRESSRSAKS